MIFSSFLNEEGQFSKAKPHPILCMCLKKEVGHYLSIFPLACLGPDELGSEAMAKTKNRDTIPTFLL